MKLQGPWKDWVLEEEHLIDPEGNKITPELLNVLFPKTINQTQLAQLLGIRRSAVQNRIKRGTLPAFDGDSKSWKLETLAVIMENEKG